jgi:hypothetical protein
MADMTGICRRRKFDWSRSQLRNGHCLLFLYKPTFPKICPPQSGLRRILSFLQNEPQLLIVQAARPAVP